jgi:hypothetical protein
MKLLIISTCILLLGCATRGLHLDPIDSSKAIVKYDSGALYEAGGKKRAIKQMTDYCKSKPYRIITSGTRVSGEKKHTTTIVFECTD